MFASRSSVSRRVATLLISSALFAGVLPFVSPSPARAMTSVFINEIHYDNDGTDTGEFIEIAFPEGTDLSGWSIVRYNGSGGAPYTTPLAAGADDLGALPVTGITTGYGFVVVEYPANGLQNGSPDGLALVDASDNVVQFLSYEGTFTALGGPADGIASTDIGASQGGPPASRPCACGLCAPKCCR